jgi:hypothetical protein
MLQAARQHTSKLTPKLCSTGIELSTIYQTSRKRKPRHMRRMICSR